MNLPNPRDLIEIHGLSAKKRFGQHFLLDRNILAKIVHAAGALNGVQAIEIGPGPGALTMELVRSPAAHVTAIEIDDRMMPALREIESAADGRLSVLHQDAMKMDVSVAVPSPRAIIANLPYNVGTQLLIGWLKLIHRAPDSIQSMTLMFQKEVAERFAASPSTAAYGKVSILAQWLCDVELLFDIPPGAFSPPPKIVSTVVRFVPRHERMFSASFEEVEAFLAVAFAQRRKMLRKTLSGYLPNTISALEHLGIDPTRRAETLTLTEVGKILHQKK
ncbi:MAG: 16S rRNA (adenine(1518)-N(6)/adenine(1519)-N(6))-dimethyltransferase RsmA [Rickettsiales bacterium]